MVLIPAKGFDHTRTVSGPPTEILDQIPTPIWRAGPDFLCDYVNRAWLSFTGRTLDQELGRGWLEDIHPEDRDRTLAVVFARSDGSQPGSRNPPHGDVSRRSCDPHARAHVRRLTRLLGV